ncbi:hypothetical protein KUCAC02_001078 [Chaenocephalus aceratus]|uniref:Uncharacterized protein n=1 Tax=Chaenocephalus aceratus TaxID=36190 RepID=A0ACB9XVB1_CHAAC|nr:hypothetical protein KUCAC02_001078 [Chaenocephalus aceratus]
MILILIPDPTADPVVSEDGRQRKCGQESSCNTMPAKHDGPISAHSSSTAAWRPPPPHRQCRTTCQPTFHRSDITSKTMRRQRGNHPATSRGKKPMTEYQEMFLPPISHKSFVTNSKQKGPYHPLKGTSAETTTLRKVHVTHKVVPLPPMARPPRSPPKDHRRHIVFNLG